MTILRMRQFVKASNFQVALLVNLAMATSVNYDKKSLLPKQGLIKKKNLFHTSIQTSTGNF